MPGSTSSGGPSRSKEAKTVESEKLLPLLHAKLRKLLRSQSANITHDDPSVKGTYLGNVITTFPKGNGSLERPASALWKNHVQGRGSIRMTISVCPAGLRAETREHGLTEYWNNRLTWCGVPHDYPNLFCWIYRHEGRKLKQELRCHAMLCGKEKAKMLSESLRNRLAEALFDFRKEKIQRQNARLACLENYLNYYTNSESVSNYKKERTSPSKLSIIEELEEESLLVPDLCGLDKVMQLLEMDIRSHDFDQGPLHHPHHHPQRTNSLSSNESSSTFESGSDIDEDSASTTSAGSTNTIMYQQIAYAI